jgi:nucleotide-binding universal stress UspA family protein
VISRTVIVPLDGSEFAERALCVADPLADRLGMGIRLLTTAWDGEHLEPEHYLERVAANRTGAVEVEVIHDRGAADAITLAAGTEPGGVVCMTTHGRGRVRWALLGSVAETVLGATTHPTILVGRRCRADWLDHGEGIVVAVDGSHASVASVPTACEWAAALDLDVWLVMVLHPLDVAAAEHAPRVLEPLAEQVRARGLTAHPLVARGTFAAGAFVDAAESVPAAMVVTATEARTGIDRAVLGSFTMATVGLVQCPVLTVPAH